MPNPTAYASQMIGEHLKVRSISPHKQTNQSCLSLYLVDSYSAGINSKIMALLSALFLS